MLTVGGKPGHKMLVQFIPDIDKGTQGPPSIATTDADGRFVLETKPAHVATSQPGAVVGWHRIVLSDLQLAESATGAGVPIRLSQQYTLPGSSPLAQEVKAGKQSIKIDVP